MGGRGDGGKGRWSACRPLVNSWLHHWADACRKRGRNG